MERFTVSRDDSIYEAWPDVALAPSGRLVCVFSECTHHLDRAFTRIMLTTSDDRGRTWSPKRPLSDARHKNKPEDPWWNCARVSALSDGRLVAVCDLVAGKREGAGRGRQENYLWFSADDGETWDGPIETPVHGIVPDQVIELRAGPAAGRLVLSAHSACPPDADDLWRVRAWTSDDRGATWDGPFTIAAAEGLKLCEASVVEAPGGELACFLRENSSQGWDGRKCLSFDAGHTWEGPFSVPLPACHRPVAGRLASGRILVTYRFMQGGEGWGRHQNLFAGLLREKDLLCRARNRAHVRILPLDYDRHPEADTGYSGWVQFDDGEILVVNYIMDDAPVGQIRGYRLRESDFLIEPPPTPSE